MQSKLPLCCIIDDPAPGINPLYYFRHQVDGQTQPAQLSGELMPPDIPTDFLREFADIAGEFGIRGKFTVLPYPAGLGSILAGWDGFSQAQCAEWLDIVRERVAPAWDITPEILTHTRVLDLATRRLGQESEHGWSQTQTADTLTRYIAAALEILRSAGFDATGVTSPCDFGSKIEPELAQAVWQAQQQVYRRSLTWYFLRTEFTSRAFLSRVMYRRGDGCAVSIYSQADDFFWQTMEDRHCDDAYINGRVDLYLSADGQSGALAELYRAGIPMIFHTHWQSLYANGRRTGLHGLRELGRRVRNVWGADVEWVPCSELARRVAAVTPP